MSSDSSVTADASRLLASQAVEWNILCGSFEWGFGKGCLCIWPALAASSIALGVAL